MELLQKEPGRVVALEDGGAVVRKTYTDGDPDDLRAAAAREFDRIGTFRDVLQRCDGATCPAPLELSLDLPPYVRMTRAAGIPLEDCLNREVWPMERLNPLGDIICRAARRYVDTFDEPYWDFILRNMLYDPCEHVVTFVDYEIPAACRPLVGDFARFSPLAFTLGTLVASAIFEARRPKRMVRRRCHRQASILVRAIIRSFFNSSDSPEPGVEQIREVALIRYGMDTSAGGRVRHAWYGAAARLWTAPGAAIDDILDLDPPICAGK